MQRRNKAKEKRCRKREGRDKMKTSPKKDTPNFDLIFLNSFGFLPSILYPSGDTNSNLD